MAFELPWRGASGSVYHYMAHTLSSSINPPYEDGNYIFCRLEEKGGKNTYYAIYIGEGDLANRVSDNHHQIDCIRKKNPTHVCWHINSNEQDRKAEESDLLAEHTEAYQPKGCNEKKGG